MEDDKNDALWTIDDQRTDSNDDQKGQISEVPSSNKNVLEVSFLTFLPSFSDLITHHHAALHQSCRNCELWLYTTSSMGSIRHIFSVQFTQWRSSIARLWKYYSWNRVDRHCYFTGGDGFTVSESV